MLITHWVTFYGGKKKKGRKTKPKTNNTKNLIVQLKTRPLKIRSQYYFSIRISWFGEQGGWMGSAWKSPMGQGPGGKRIHGNWLIFKDQPSSRVMQAKQQEVRQKCWEVYMDEQGAHGKSQTQTQKKPTEGRSTAGNLGGILRHCLYMKRQSSESQSLTEIESGEGVKGNSHGFSKFN